MKRKRTFGRYVAVDARDGKYRLASPKKTGRINRRWNTGPWLGNQSQTQHCVGYGWAHWLHSQPIRQYVDPDGLYALAQHLDEWEGTDYDGTSVRAGAKVLKALGAIAEYRWAKSAAAVAAHVLEVGPVVVGTDWYEGMDEPSRFDQSALVTLSGKLLGGHCYLIFGYRSKSGLFAIKNSYGRQWGSGGFAEIAADDLQTLLDLGGEACVGIERKFGPK